MKLTQRHLPQVSLTQEALLPKPKPQPLPQPAQIYWQPLSFPGETLTGQQCHEQLSWHPARNIDIKEDRRTGLPVAPILFV